MMLLIGIEYCNVSPRILFNACKPKRQYIDESCTNLCAKASRLEIVNYISLSVGFTSSVRITERPASELYGIILVTGSVYHTTSYRGTVVDVHFSPIISLTYVQLLSFWQDLWLELRLY